MNDPFIAYGLTTLDLRLILAPFFLGRLVSYSLWVLGSSSAARFVAAEYPGLATWFNAYFVASQVLVLLLVWAFVKIDWACLLEHGRLRRARGAGEPRDPGG